MQNEADPTRWDHHYQQGETPWEKGSAAPPLLEYLEANPLQGRVLVPGCGFGHDARAIAAAASDSEIIGLDISATAVAQAGDFPKAGNERFVQADLFDLPADLRGSFDWVFEHTFLSGLPLTLRPNYADAFHDALKPGGQVLAIFFLTPWDEGETPEPPPHGVSTAELDEMFADRFELEKEWLPQKHHPGREGRELMRLLRKMG